MSLTPVIMAVFTLGAVWWYVVIYSQADNNAVPAEPVATQSAPADSAGAERTGLQEPPAAGGLQEPPGASDGVKEPPGAEGVQEPPGAEKTQAKEDEDAPLQALGDGDAPDAPKTAHVPDSV